MPGTGWHPLAPILTAQMVLQTIYYHAWCQAYAQSHSPYAIVSLKHLRMSPKAWRPSQLAPVPGTGWHRLAHVPNQILHQALR